MELDLTTRIEVLDIALHIEKSVTDLVMSYLSVSVEKRKGITNASGGLTFKNKIDLLHDIKIFTKEEHLKLLLIMEFRNQFMHNFECNTFEDAVLALGTSHKNRLLAHLTKSEKDKNSADYKLAFANLFADAVKIIEAKNKFKNDVLNKNAELMDGLSSGFAILAKFYHDLTRFTLSELKKSRKGENIELIDFQRKVFDLIDETKSLEPVKILESFNPKEFQEALNRIAVAAIS